MTAAEDIFGRNEDMIFVSHYDSPLGMIYMAADDDVLKGVWFEGQKYFASGLDKKETEDKETPVFKKTKEWNRSFFRRWRRRAQSSRKRYGRSCL